MPPPRRPPHILSILESNVFGQLSMGVWGAENTRESPPGVQAESWAPTQQDSWVGDSDAVPLPSTLVALEETAGHRVETADVLKGGGRECPPLPVLPKASWELSVGPLLEVWGQDPSRGRGATGGCRAESRSGAAGRSTGLRSEPSHVEVEEGQVRSGEILGPQSRSSSFPRTRLGV